MKLYPKKLSSLEELKREKRLLQLAKDELEDEELFSLEGLKNQAKGSWKSMLPGKLATYAEFIPVSGFGADMLKKLAGRMLRHKRKEKQVVVAYPHEEKSEKGNVVKTVAVEVLGGYLKWKAIELTYKGIMRLVRSKSK